MITLEEIFKSDAPKAGRDFHLKVFPKINRSFAIISNALSGGTGVLAVSNGINTFTGGTIQFPSVNVTGLTLDNLIVSGETSFGAISATTIFSGSTDLSLLIGGGGGDITRVSNGINTYTGGTDNLPTINISGLTVNNINVSGETELNTLFFSQEIEEIIAGENLIYGDLVYLSGDSKYYKADNSDETTSRTELRISLSAITANNSGNALISGNYTTTGLTAGSQYWIGTLGTFTATQPTSNNTIVRYIGTALNSTTLEFNPDEIYLEISNNYSNIEVANIRIISTSQTVLPTDFTLKCISGLTVTIPTAVGIAGKIYNIKNSSDSNVNIIPVVSGQTIDSYTGLTTTGNVSSKSFPNITLQSDGTNWLII